MSRKEKIEENVSAIGSALVAGLLFILTDYVHDELKSLLQVGFLWVVPWVSFLVKFLFAQNKNDYLSQNKKLFLGFFIFDCVLSVLAYKYMPISY